MIPIGVKMSATPSVSLGTSAVAGSFYWFKDGSDRPIAHNDMYVADLDGDGAEEVVLAGFETQPNTPAEFSNLSVRMFGWEGGLFKDITSKWMPGGLNDLEGVGDVKFGDFNGDGRLDIYFAGNADMNYKLSSFVFYNQGGNFVRQDLGKTSWEHGVSVADINSDGFDDVLVAGYIHPSIVYMGSKSGLVKTKLELEGDVNSYEAFASGITAGNFLGTKEKLVVVVDSATGNGTGSDTRLLRPYYLDGQVVGYQFVATLPTPRLENPSFGLTADPAGPKSHDVRVRTVDFNRDGLDDVIVFSRAAFDGHEWPEVSQMQFLRNFGGGRFEDVTDSVLIGYNTYSNAPYSPRIKDFNGDGLVDIFSSNASFSKVHDSTNLFLGKSDGTFVNTGDGIFSAPVDSWGGVGTLAKGPDGSYYLVTDKFTQTGGKTGLKSTISIQRLVFNDDKSGGSTSTSVVKNVTGTDGNDNLAGTSGSDSISGLVGNDTQTGLAGDDTLDGGAGNDSMVGGLGDDTYYVDSTGDKVVEFANQGTDTVVSDISLSLAKVANVENWVGIGSADIAATGNALGNALTGNSGANTIDGGLGIDTLTGGVGVDTFVFSSKLGATNTDTITDFVSGTDKIQLSKSVFSKFKAGAVPQANFVSGGANTKALDSNDYLIFNGSQLLYDADGSGKGVAVVVANIVGTVLASDLVVV